MSNKFAKSQQVTNENSSRKVTLQQQEFYSGVVPKAEELEKYDHINPGFSERLFKMAEIEQAGRLALQNKMIDTQKELTLKDLSYQKQGIWVGFLSVVVIVAFCTYLAYLGAVTEAAAALAITIGLAGIFVIRQYNKKNDLDNNNKEE